MVMDNWDDENDDMVIGGFWDSYSLLKHTHCNKCNKDIPSGEFYGHVCDPPEPCQQCAEKDAEIQQKDEYIARLKYSNDLWEKYFDDTNGEYAQLEASVERWRNWCIDDSQARQNELERNRELSIKLDEARRLAYDLLEFVKSLDDDVPVDKVEYCALLRKHIWLIGYLDSEPSTDLCPDCGDGSGIWGFCGDCLERRR